MWRAAGAKFRGITREDHSRALYLAQEITVVHLSDLSDGVELVHPGRGTSVEA